ncbi:unnamed protein product [Acanthoscelides obtectus]|uniref:Uncharacterized protein n=1 Tax=Acanthoscelides obtectus TaxID=200917 RepID=A0A9P0P366_ACAOB|nr:unnamed protein product [Acanthoscelides obtectus]CAK1648500.1 hypothetical protein AOBTE_LOCUS15730 [Acanthoscelides obtectus]
MDHQYEIIYKKGKCNTNADALSHIHVNAVESASVINNPGDIDQDIQDYLNQLFANKQSLPDLEENTLALLNSDLGNPITASQPLDSSRKIHILQDIQVAPPNNIQNSVSHESPKDSETETAHTCNAENNFNDGIPILDEIINNKGPVSAKSAQHCISPQTNGLRIRHCRTWATVDARGSSASNTWTRQIYLL